MANVDLFVPGLNFGFGEADRQHRAAVMSLQRLRGDEAMFVGRPASEAIYRIGLLFAATPVLELLGPQPAHRGRRALLERLHEPGYVYVKNLVTEPRSAEGDPARLSDLAAELVRLEVDLIVVTGGSGATRVATQATTTIPIVAAYMGCDPR